MISRHGSTRQAPAGVRLLAGAAALALLCVSPSPASGTAQERTELSVWEDPGFQKSFLGSYGVQSDVEPRVTTVEREQLERILPLMASDPDRALRELEKAAIPEASAIFDFTLGNLRFQRDELDRAAAHYAAALAKFPAFRRAHKNLGLIQVRTGDYERAIESLGRVIELGGGDGTTYGLLGYSYASTGNHVSAESAYRSAVLLDPEVLDWKLGLTQSVYRQRKYGDTLALCDELITRFPNRADFWLLQANTWIGLNQPLKAAEDFEIVRRMGQATIQSLNTLGDIYVNEGLHDLAAGVYAEAARMDAGQSPDRPLRNVEVLAQRGALEEAAGLLGTVKEIHGAQLDPAEKIRLLKLESRLALAEGEGEGAAGVLEEIVALDPLDGEALILLGQHYARIEEPERAIFYYERAQSLEGFEAEAAVRHAQLLVRLTRYREAVPLLKRAQELRPRDEVARYLEQVERIARTR
jgi:tetratricopeptide (TPR) repeat protein